MLRVRSTPVFAALLLAASLLAPRTLAQPGALDPTFGDGGVILLNAYVSGVEADDGRVVACGNIGSSDPVVWRFLPDGSPDPTFGEGGVATDGIASSCFDVEPSLSGGVYAVGSWEPFNGVFAGVIVRFGDDGLLDPAFGADGVLVETAGGTLRSVSVLPDGRIAVAGGSSGLGASNCTAARHLPDGTLDPSFGDDGVVSVTSGPSDPEQGLTSACNASTFDDVGRIVFATSTRVDGDVVAWAGLRLLADASVDPTFEPVVDLPELDHLLAVESAPDGYVTFGGINDSVAPTLVRFTEEGALDASFGEGGVATLGVPGAFYSMDLALQPDGKLLIGSSDWVARVLADGTLDPTFGEGGVATLDLSGVARITSLAPDAEGRLIVGGEAGGFGFIARLLSEGAVKIEPATQPERVNLSAPAPNPTSGRTSLTYTLTAPAPVRLTVYDVLGREVTVPATGSQVAGHHEVTLDASRLASGLYVVHLSVGGKAMAMTRRFTVLR